ncbi:MAG: histidine kinase dimerization/phospho-acceptor domain-containing protein, partial [Pyrinomonadaceae bacterium]
MTLSVYIALTFGSETVLQVAERIKEFEAVPGFVIIPIIVSVFGILLLSHKMSFPRLIVLTILLLVIYYSIFVLAESLFNTNIGFYYAAPAIILAVILNEAINIIRLEIALKKQLVEILESKPYMKSDSADSRVETGLKLLRTVLNVSDVVVFIYDKHGKLQPVGRARDGSGGSQNWSKNFSFCETAIAKREILVEILDERKQSATIAMPLKNNHEIIGGLFVEISERFEADDRKLLESFGEQLARNFQRKRLQNFSGEKQGFDWVLSRTSQENRLNLSRLISGMVCEQSFGIRATADIAEAHAIAYLDGTLAFANYAMCEVLGFEPKKVAQADLFDLLNCLKTELFNEPRLAIRKVLQTGEPFFVELDFPDDCETRELQVRLINIEDEDVASVKPVPKPACFLISLRNVSQRKENEKLRSDMVNLMSHELRTPITSINGFAEMLLMDEDLPQDMREFLFTIESESKRASKMLTNFLTVSNLEQSDKKEFHPSSVRLNQVVDDVIEIMREPARRKRIRLVERNQNMLPPVSADRGLLTKAIMHLVENAVKYSPERSSVIISTLMDTEFLNVEVEDRGYGIPTEELEKIWTKFYRFGRDGLDYEEESTGLGLSVVKVMMQKDRGDAQVVSEVGR